MEWDGERELTADEAFKIVMDFLYVHYGKSLLMFKRYSGSRNKKRVTLYRIETGICPCPLGYKGYETPTEVLRAAARAVRRQG